MNVTDPSGLEVPGYHHFYALFLGGNDAQPLFPLTEGEHTKAHDVLRKHDVGRKQGLDYAQARANWEKLPKEKQRAIILEAMKAADIPDSLANKYIDHVFEGASPGTNNSKTRKTPKQSQLFDRAALEQARKEAKLAKEATEKAAKGSTLKRIGKRIPGVKIGVILFFWAQDAQAKGPGAGTANSAIDLIPLVGDGKGIIELFTGDLIPDKGEKSPLEKGLGELFPSVVNPPIVPSVLPYAGAKQEYIMPRRSTGVPSTIPREAVPSTLRYFMLRPSFPPR